MGALCSQHDECTKEGGCSRGTFCTDGPSCPTNKKICRKKGKSGGKKKRKEKMDGEGTDSGLARAAGFFWKTVVKPHGSDLTGVVLFSLFGVVATWWTGLVTCRRRDDSETKSERGSEGK